MTFKLPFALPDTTAFPADNTAVDTLLQAPANFVGHWSFTEPHFTYAADGASILEVEDRLGGQGPISWVSGDFMELQVAPTKKGSLLRGARSATLGQTFEYSITDDPAGWPGGMASGTIAVVFSVMEAGTDNLIFVLDPVVRNRQRVHFTTSNRLNFWFGDPLSDARILDYNERQVTTWAIFSWTATDHSIEGLRTQRITEANPTIPLEALRIVNTDAIIHDIIIYGQELTGTDLDGLKAVLDSYIGNV